MARGQGGATKVQVGRGPLSRDPTSLCPLVNKASMVQPPIVHMYKCHLYTGLNVLPDSRVNHSFQYFGLIVHRVRGWPGSNCLV